MKNNLYLSLFDVTVFNDRARHFVAIITLTVLSAALFFDWSAGIQFLSGLPFVIAGGGFSSGGGGGSDSNQNATQCSCTGGGTTDSGGSTGGSTDDSTGGTGGSTGGTGSTPYLYVANEQGEFEVFNDVMIGNPSTFYRDIQVARDDYFNHRIGPDHVPLDLSRFARADDGSIRLQVKEIEPEESYIHRIAVADYEVPRGQMVMQHADHQALYAVDPLSIVDLGSEVVHSQDGDVSGQFDFRDTEISSMQTTDCLLEQGQTLEFAIPKETRALTIESLWRGWVAGSKHTTQSRYQSSFSRLSLKSLSLTMMTFVAGLFVVNGSASDTSDAAELNFLQKSVGNNVAHANSSDSGDGGGSTGGGTTGGGGKSLNVYYYNHIFSSWVRCAVVQPRVRSTGRVLVQLPQEILNLPGGTVQIRIQATKDHYVRSISRVQSDVTQIVPSKVVNMDIKNLMVCNEHIQEATNKESIHLVPGQSFEFSYTPTDVTTHIAVEFAGYYTLLSPEGQNKAGDWISRLSEEERTIVESIADISEYQTVTA